MLATDSYVARDAMEVGSTPSPARPHCTWKRGAPSSSWAVPPGTLLHCGPVSKQRSRSWKPVQASVGNGGSAGSPANKTEPDENVMENLSTLLGSCEQLKAMTDSSSSSGVGLDMRNRIDHLLKRVRMLKQSTERAARAAGGRVPSQLIASFKVLQREHSSVENIVRLATQAGPLLSEEEEANELGNGGLSVIPQKSSLSMNYGADTVTVEFAQGHENGSCVEVLSGPKYVMSTPLREGSFKLNAVRAEIERRVMEQMSRNPGRSDSEEVSKEEFQSKWELQHKKVSTVNQKILEEDKTDADSAPGRDKRFITQTGDAQLCDKQEAEFGERRENLESARTMLLELYEQMCMRFDNGLSNLREKHLDVANDLRRQEDTLLALKENMVNEQRKILEKISELSLDVTQRLGVEQSSNQLRKMIFDMDEDVKRMQGQFVSLGSDLNMKGKILAEWGNLQEKIRDEFQLGISRLESRLNQREERLEELNPQSILAELQSVKVTLSGLRESQLLEQTVLADWQSKSEHLENSFLTNSEQIKMLSSEFECRVRKDEVINVLNKVLVDLEIQRNEVQESLKCVNAEQMKTASYLGMLQEEWRGHRKEFQMQIWEMKDKLTIVETTQNESLLVKISFINEKLSDLQEEQKHERSLLSETQQKMVALEEKGLDLLRQMNDNAEEQKQGLLKEVRALVEELFQTARVHQKETMQGSPTHQQESNAKKDAGYIRKLVHSSSSYPSEASTEQQGQHVHDKGTASLEAFFSVMGHLIREELKKKDVISALTLPSSEIGQPGESDKSLFSDQIGNPSGRNADKVDQAKSIVLRYASNWKRAFIHYCPDNLGWTEAPGVAMYNASNPHGINWKEFRVAAARLEFVVTDGQGNWDRAPNGQNYLLEKAGIFELAAGVLKAAASP